MPGAVVALRLPHAGDLEREGDVVEHGAPGERRLLLEDHPDRGMRAVDALARDLDGSLIAVEQPADDVEQRRLAAAGGTDHRQKLAGRHVERDMIDGGEHPVGRLEPLDDVLDHQDRAARPPLAAPALDPFRRHGKRGHGGVSSPLRPPSCAARLSRAVGPLLDALPYSIPRRSGARMPAAKLSLAKASPAPAASGRPARRHQFSQARLMP